MRWTVAMTRISYPIYLSIYLGTCAAAQVERALIVAILTHTEQRAYEHS
jgi:hypothetical protein